jgi:hypothetical protein
MTKLTFSLDDATVAELKRLARQTRKPQSVIVRDAIARYGAEPDRYSAEEAAARARQLELLLGKIPPRPQRAVDEELAAIRTARRRGGRRRRIE